MRRHISAVRPAPSFPSCYVTYVLANLVIYVTYVLANLLFYLYSKYHAMPQSLQSTDYVASLHISIYICTEISIHAYVRRISCFY